MSDPVARYGLPHVTIPRDAVKECPGSPLDELRREYVRRVDAWLSLPRAERDRIIDERLAARELERDEWLRQWAADQRTIGLAAVDAQLDKLCTDAGLDPYLAWRRPRANERAARLAETTATIRRDLAAAGHKPVTNALEQYGVRVVTDPDMPADRFDLVDDAGTVLGSFEARA